MLPVLNLLPKAGLPEATLATHDASPEQSVPAGVSPPGMYGVPDTCEISDIKAARANMGKTLTTLLSFIQNLCWSSLLKELALIGMVNLVSWQRVTVCETNPIQQIRFLTVDFIAACRERYVDEAIRNNAEEVE